MSTVRTYCVVVDPLSFQCLLGDFSVCAASVSGLGSFLVRSVVWR